MKSFSEYSYFGISKFLKKEKSIFKDEFLQIFEDKEKFFKYSNDFYEKFKPNNDLIIHKIASFWSIRAILGPLMEALILYDKVLFLNEHNSIQYVNLVRVFDDKLSPRNFSLIAIKK